MKTYLSLTRFAVSLLVSFSAITGYILYKPELSLNFLMMFLGVYFLSSGSSALNQVQEHTSDRLMQRTKNRAIPSGKLTLMQTLVFSVFNILTGLMILIFFSGMISFLLGLFTLLWYNLLYTNLKTKTAFAVVPGSLTGSLPPLIGWTAAGGNLFDPAILLIAIFIFIWQIPHFWILLYKHGEDYEKAGLGTITSKFSENQYRKVLFVWIIATAIYAMFFQIFGIVQNYILSGIIYALSIILIILASELIFQKLKQNFYKILFIYLNSFLLLCMIVIVLDRVFYL